MDYQGLIARLRSKLRAAWPILPQTYKCFFADSILLWASGLTYTVALSIIPVMALAFSLVKGLGAFSRLEPFIQRYLALESPETSSRLLQLTQNINAGTLGTVGAAFLLVTVVSTLGTIEAAFNRIWRAPYARTYLRKFTDYISVLLTLPLLLAAALALSASVSRQVMSLPLLGVIGTVIILWAGFLFLFMFFPNTEVKFKPALIGSFVTAVLFDLAQWGYVHFQIGVANYRAIYGALAAIPILLVWIYVAWVIVLGGAELAANTQRGVPRVPIAMDSPGFVRTAVLLTMLRLGERAGKLRDGVTLESLAAELGVQTTSLRL